MSSFEIKISSILGDIGYIVKPYADISFCDQPNVIYSQVSLKNLPRMKLDFALINAQIAIEAQGNYWHAINTSSLKTHQAESLLRDSRKKKILNKQGWKLIQIHEKHLLNTSFQSYLQSSIWKLLDI